MILPKISVVIPAYNVEQYFERCLLSITNQSLKEIEIVIVIDGSTDGTHSIAKEFQEKDSRIKIIKTKNNGPGMARNIGLENATGNYILFIDADDWISDESLFLLHTSAEKNNADIICFGYQRILPGGRVIDETKKKNITCTKYHLIVNDSKELLGDFLSMYGHGVSNKLIRKDFLDRNDIRFESDRQTQAEDLYVSYQLLFLYPNVIFVNMPLYNYVQHETSSLHVTPEKIGDRYLQLFERIYEKIPNNENKTENEKIVAWLAYYMTTFIYTNWKQNEYSWFRDQFRNYNPNPLYNYLMRKSYSIPKINNESTNIYILRKIYCFLSTRNAFAIANLLMFFRLSFLPNLKRRIK